MNKLITTNQMVAEFARVLDHQPIGIIGRADQIREIICGPQDHNEHCKGWRWHLYVQDDKKRHDAVMTEVRLMAAERRAREEARQSNIIQMAAE